MVALLSGACALEWDRLDPRAEGNAGRGGSSGSAGGESTGTGAGGGQGGQDAATGPGGGGAGGAAGEGGARPIVTTFGERPNATVNDVTSDTQLHASFPTLNYGASDVLWADRAPDQPLLIRFDLGAIAGTSVQSAELHLVTGTVPDAQSPDTAEVHRVLESWIDGSENAVAGVANYTMRNANTPWSTPGAASPGSSDAGVLATFLPANQNTEYVVSLPSSLVQSWIDDPQNNHGLLVTMGGDNGSAYVSTESVDAANRPLLVVIHLP